MSILHALVALVFLGVVLWGASRLRCLLWCHNTFAIAFVVLGVVVCRIVPGAGAVLNSGFESLWQWIVRTFFPGL